MGLPRKTHFNQRPHPTPHMIQTPCGVMDIVDCVENLNDVTCKNCLRVLNAKKNKNSKIRLGIKSENVRGVEPQRLEHSNTQTN